MDPSQGPKNVNWTRRMVPHMYVDSSRHGSFAAGPVNTKNQDWRPSPTRARTPTSSARHTLQAAEPRRALQRALEGRPRRPQGGNSAWLFPVTNLKHRSKGDRGGLKEVILLGFSQLQTSNLVKSQLQTQLLTSYKPSYKPTVTQLGTFEQY